MGYLEHEEKLRKQAAANDAARWRAKNPESYQESQRKYKAKPEAKAKARIAQQKYRENNREEINRKKREKRNALGPEEAKKINRRENLKRNYGITPEEYDALSEAQNGLCAICERPETRKGMEGQLVVDHCHDTNEVRGLLCSECNVGMGKLNDDPDLLRKAIDYLEG